jgi:hypothetical protein
MQEPNLDIRLGILQSWFGCGDENNSVTCWKTPVCLVHSKSGC